MQTGDITAGPEPSKRGREFLRSIAGLGEAEADLSERDEDILSKEIDPVRGWGFDSKELP